MIDAEAVFSAIQQRAAFDAAVRHLRGNTRAGMYIHSSVSVPTPLRSSLRLRGLVSLRFGSAVKDRHLTVKPGGYPKFFGNGENVPLRPECFSGKLTGTLKEYPIMSGGGVYAGGRPGAHRLIVQDVRPSLIVFCGLITHSGAVPDNSFVACKP